MSVPYGWLRPLAVVVTAFVAVETFQASPSPGLHGLSLDVSVALAAFVVGTGSLMAVPVARAGLRPALILLSVLGSAALIRVQPDGPGFLGAFFAVGSAALSLPAAASAGILVVAVASLATGWLLTAHPRVQGIVQVDIGVVGVYGVAMVARRFRETTEEQTRLVIELEQTRAAQAQAAALAERQRLAREMHDVLAHTLSGLVLNLEGARLMASRGDASPAVADAVDRAHRLAKSGLTDARRAIGMLRDDELPGPERLAGLASEFSADSGVPCAFDSCGDPFDLGPEARLTLYRVAQEALTNVCKHAAAVRVELRLAYGPGGACLSVEDFVGGNGSGPSGLPPGSSPELSASGAGYGLTGMQERAELLGGSLRAGPTEHGFRVELEVPR
ncbi:MAG TPA: histidine kinase [Actinomycetota bacterium]|nr:histidine kinase [Actinomycetota bacterium]